MECSLCTFAVALFYILANGTVYTHIFQCSINVTMPNAHAIQLLTVLYAFIGMRRFYVARSEQHQRNKKWMKKRIFAVCFVEHFYEKVLKRKIKVISRAG